MASRPKGFGMAADFQAKKDDKYDENRAKEAIEWINVMVPSSPRLESYDANSVHEMLKDGVWLCRLANAIDGGSVQRINESKMSFKQMENIGNFLDASYNMGVSKTDQFQVVDLYEQENMPQVIDGLHSLGRNATARGKQGI